METNIIERKIQKVPKIWRLEPKHGSPATMELCSITEIIKIYSYRYMTIFWKSPSKNVKYVPPSQPHNHLTCFSALLSFLFSLCFFLGFLNLSLFWFLHVFLFCFISQIFSHFFPCLVYFPLKSVCERKGQNKLKFNIICICLKWYCHYAL